VYISPQLAGLVLSVIPPLAIVGVVFGRYLKRISAQVQDALAQTTATAEVPW
jgi:ATP-binding cassette subfamily B (MDR/TAP) protein 10